MHLSSINICHILPKLDELTFLLLENNTHILGSCETFLNSHINDVELSIQCYTFERKGRANKSGGGLIVYEKESISYTRRFDLENTIESIWIQINFTNTKPFLITFVYRPPVYRQD